jgi:hypothetical protein
VDPEVALVDQRWYIDHRNRPDFEFLRPGRGRRPSNTR